MRIGRTAATQIASQIGTHTAIATAHQNAPGLITTHKGDADAHHTTYTDVKALAAAVAGGLNAVIWKDASEQALSDADRTATLDYTDLDLTAFTSADAKFAILKLTLNVDSITGGKCTLSIRKNGTTPDHKPSIIIGVEEGDIALARSYGHVILAVDADEVIEYAITITATIQVDTKIEVLGYIE